MARRRADRAGDAPDPAPPVGRGPSPRDAAPTVDRAAYEAEQAALLRALISGDDFPEGVDAAKAAAASRSLWRKRMRSVQSAWPALAIGLGEEFERRFEAFARAVAPPAVGWGFTDGLAFARSLPRRELTGDARVELLLARAVAVTRRGGRVRERRGLFLGALAVREPPRILVVLRAPVAGRRHLVVSLARPRLRP